MFKSAECTVILSCNSTTAGRYTHFDKTHTDKSNHYTRYQRSNNLLGIFQYTADKHLHSRSGNGSTEYRTKSASQSGRNNRTDKRETCSLDTKQSTSYRTYPSTLNKSRDSRCKQRHGNKKTCSFKIKTQRTRNNKRWSNNSHENSQQVLQCSKNSILKRRTVIQTIN